MFKRSFVSEFLILMSHQLLSHNQYQLRSTKINQDQPISTKIIKYPPKSNEINQEHLISTKIKKNEQRSFKINKTFKFDLG